MKINLCGVNLAHDKSFCINRPNGSGDNLFIHTRTPILIMENGKMTRYPSETTVFFRKGMPQQFMAAGYIYADDYIHFNADDEEMEFIDSLNIPSGVPFKDLDSSIYMNIHRYICIEHQAKTENSDTSINLLIKYLLIKLSQAINESKAVSVNNATKNAIRELHAHIYANVEEDYTIDSLAASVGLSPSYFQSIYKKMFGRSCMNDVIIARIEKAKTLLMSTELSIYEIARMCGYENDSHFARQFKKITYVTASEFRKNDVNANKVK